MSLDFRYEEGFTRQLYNAVIAGADYTDIIKKELKSLVKVMDLKELIALKDINSMIKVIVIELKNAFIKSESSIPKHIALQAGWYYRKEILPALEIEKGVFNSRVKIIENTHILGSLSLEKALILFKDTEKQSLDILSPELISAIQHVEEGNVLLEYFRPLHGEDGIRPVGIVLGYK